VDGQENKRLKHSLQKKVRHVIFNHKVQAVLIMVVPTAVLIAALYFSGKVVDQVTYDCRILMGGWHPDVPVKVMEECRKLRSGK